MKAKRVIIVGNSNSIMRHSFSAKLQAVEGITLKNHSIGENYNIILLDFIARLDFVDGEFIIIETSIMDAHWRRMGLITDSSILLNLKTALTEIRSKSNAKVLLLILPIRTLLFAGQSDWIEATIQDIAAEFSVDVLNGYSLIRHVIGKWKGPPDNAALATQELLLAADLDHSLWSDFLWQTGYRFPLSPLSAIARIAFIDQLHVSEFVHCAISDLILEWIRQGTEQPATEPAYEGLPLTRMTSEASGGLPLKTISSSLITRQYWDLNNDQVAIYDIDPEYIAVGLEFNRAGTYGITTLTGSSGQTFIADMRFATHNSTFIASIYPITADIGVGDMTIRVAPTSDRPVAQPTYWAMDIAREGSRAEIGKLILLRRDWVDRCVTSNKVRRGNSLELTQSEWGVQLVSKAFGSITAAAANSADASSSMAVSRLMARAIMSTRRATEMGGTFSQIRLMIVAGDLQGALALVKEGFSEDGPHLRFRRLQMALQDFLLMLGQ